MRRVVLLLCITLQLKGADPQSLSTESSSARVSQKQLPELVREGSIGFVTKVFRAQPELRRILNVQREGGRTLLMDALFNEDPQVAHFLIGKGADPHIPDDKGQDAFAKDFSYHRGHLTHLKKIFDAYYQEQNKRNFEDEDAITQSSWMRKIHGISERGCKFIRERALLHAVVSLNVAAVEHLLDNKVDQRVETLSNVDRDGNSLHNICMKQLDTEEKEVKAEMIIAALMQAPHARECLEKKMYHQQSRRTIMLKPLDILFHNGDKQRLIMFENAGLYFDASHVRRVIKKAYVEGFKALSCLKPKLIKDLNINTQDENGETLLTSVVADQNRSHFIRCSPKNEMVQLLLEVGADPLQRNAAGEDAYAIDFRCGGGNVQQTFLRDSFHEYMERQGRPLAVDYGRKNIDVCAWLALHHGAQFKVADGFRFLKQERCKHMFDMLNQCSDLNEDSKLNTQLLAKALSYIDWERGDDYESQRSDVIALLIDNGADPSSGELLDNFRAFHSRMNPFVVMLNVLSSRPEFKGKNIFQELRSITWASFGKSHLRCLARDICSSYPESSKQKYTFKHLEQLLKANIDLRVKVPEYLFEYNTSADLIRLWCKYGADINAQDEGGNTVFMSLAREGEFNQDMVTCAQDLGADLSIENKHEQDLVELLAGNVCHWRSEYSDQQSSLKALDQLLEAHEDSQARAQDCLLKHNKSADLIRLWCKYGADINAQDEDGDTVFMSLAREDKFNQDMVTCAKDLGADLSIKNKFSDDLFGILAVRSSIYNVFFPQRQKTSLKSLKKMLEANVELARSQEYLFKYNNSVDLIRLWCKYGADINAQDENGDTVFMLVAHRGKFNGAMEACAKDLGADLSIKNKKGQDVFELRDRFYPVVGGTSWRNLFPLF